MSWKNIIDDAKDSIENIVDDVKDDVKDAAENVVETVVDVVKDGVENLVDKAKEIDIQEVLNSDEFKKIASLVLNGKNILAYSLLKYVATEAAKNSDSSSGWNRAGNTLTAVGNAIDNLLLINSQNNSAVTTIDASNATNNLVLVGNALSNIIKGGSGSSTLWGGGEGNNTLTGGAARDLFWYLGGGNDIVTNFLTGTANNSDVAVLAGNLLSVSRDGENISINLAGGNSLTLKTGSTSSDDVIMYSADGENISGAKIADSSADSLTYYSGAKYFQLSNAGTLQVTDAENNNIRLDGSAGKIFSNIVNIVASAATGANILAGNSASNSIVGGAGTSSLWGGAGDVSDTLVGGEGADTFWYGKNDGADVISNSSATDTINLYNINLSDIVSANVSNNQISATFSNGAQLAINFSDSLSSKINLADNTSWQFNKTSGNWQSV